MPLALENARRKTCAPKLNPNGDANHWVPDTGACVNSFIIQAGSGRFRQVRAWRKPRLLRFQCILKTCHR